MYVSKIFFSGDDVSYQIGNDHLFLTTTNSTKFLDAVGKEIEVKNFIMALAAAPKSDSLIEFRLVGHVNCSSMKDFQSYREVVRK